MLPHLSFPLSIIILAMGLNLSAQEVIPYTKVIFKDDFSASTLSAEWVLDKAKPEFKNGILIVPKVDGSEPTAGSGCSVVTPPLVNMEFTMSFQLDIDETVAISWKDKEFTGSHAGQIAQVSISGRNIIVCDEKTGVFKNEIYNMKEKDADTLSLLESKTVTLPIALPPNMWFKLFIRIEGDTLSVRIDDHAVGSFSSEGFAHSSKRQLAIMALGKQVSFDNVMITAPENN